MWILRQCYNTASLKILQHTLHWSRKAFKVSQCGCGLANVCQCSRRFQDVCPAYAQLARGFVIHRDETFNRYIPVLSWKLLLSQQFNDREGRLLHRQPTYRLTRAPTVVKASLWIWWIRFLLRSLQWKPNEIILAVSSQLCNGHCTEKKS